MIAHILSAFLNGDLGGALWSSLGGILSGAGNELRDRFNELTGHDSVQEWLSDLADNYLPDYSTLESAREDLNELLENVTTWGAEVVSDIGDAIQDILDTGDIEPQADGGLGETHDIFKPEDEAVPDVPVGELPGFGTEGGGQPRDGGGGSSESYGGGSDPGGTTPLGESGEPPSGSSPEQPPTHEDLGLNPDDGSYIEHHPNEGEVVIHYPDGTTETRSWP